MKQQSGITYIPKERTRFNQELRNKVKNYFKENNLSEKGNTRLYIKTFIFLAGYTIPYLLIISNQYSSYFMLLLCFIIGISMAGIGLCVMHDANHNSYSSNHNLNQFIGYTLNFIGGSALNWKIKHNIFHHTHTNIHHEDEDISSGSIAIKLSPHGKTFPWHKYQHFYAPILYCLFTIRLVFIADFVRFNNYSKSGLLEKYSYNKNKEFAILLLSKFFYIIYMIILPFYLVDVTITQFIIGFLLLHFTASIILITSFVAGHVFEESVFPLPNDKNNISNEWYIHQLTTTANFSTNNKWLTWFIGGLNYQIEHHLFPNISHVHYPKIAPIVKKLANQYGLPYHEFPSVVSILKNHINLLKQLGNDT